MNNQSVIAFTAECLCNIVLFGSVSFFLGFLSPALQIPQLRLQPQPQPQLEEQPQEGQLHPPQLEEQRV